MASTPEQTQDYPVDDLRAQLGGELIIPGDPDYDASRQVFFKGWDRKPLAVARVADAADVGRVVTAARETGLDLAVRSGGHSRPGYGTVDGGLVIDLSAMNAIEVDADSRAAWVQTGATAGQYTLATSEHGLATGLGDTGSVGVGGLTLSGGIGYLVRHSGLTIDNLLSAEVVTADGELVQTSEDSEPDLFWAIRGGEGNFGVVTRLQLRLHEVSEIFGGMLMLPATPETITGFLAAAEAAPEELSAIANVMIAPPMPMIPEEAHGKPVIMSLYCYAGPADKGEEALAPFRALGNSYADMLRPMRYPQLYEGPEQEPRFGVGTSLFVESLAGDAPEAMLEWLPKSTAMMKVVQLRVLGGAYGRPSNDAMAFAHRDRNVMVNVTALFGDPAEQAAHQEWVSGISDALVANGAGGYVGFLDDLDEEAMRACFPGGNWERLRGLKRRYDPNNLFHLNHNIPPAEG